MVRNEEAKSDISLPEMLWIRYVGDADWECDCIWVNLLMVGEQNYSV